MSTQVVILIVTGVQSEKKSTVCVCVCVCVCVFCFNVCFQKDTAIKNETRQAAKGDGEGGGGKLRA